MRSLKCRRQCEGCQQKVGARFRALLNLFLCRGCYETWTRTGVVPSPTVDGEPEERRW